MHYGIILQNINFILRSRYDLRCLKATLNLNKEKKNECEKRTSFSLYNLYVLIVVR